MKVLILSGFLGSGKTTALMQLAHYIVNNSESESENKVIILENEVGEVGIDDAFLRSGGFFVDNLFAGCACCTVSGDLVNATMRIHAEYDPEWLIIETTGIAYPKKVQENLMDALKLSSRICVLVDAFRWNRLLLPMNALLGGQIESSDAVLINKIDLVDEETLKKVERDVMDFDSNTQILQISAMVPIPDEIWQKALGTYRE